MRARRLLVCAVALLAGLAACSGNDDDNSSITVPTDDTTTTTSSTSTSTTTSTTTTTDPDQAVREEVERRYVESWDAYLEVLADPDPDHPLIDEFYVGDSRQIVRDTMVTALSEGWVARRPEDPAKFTVTVNRVDIVDTSNAELVACVVNGVITADIATGDVLDDDVVTYRIDVEMRRVDGAWRQATGTEERIGEGAQQCGT